MILGAVQQCFFFYIHYYIVTKSFVDSLRKLSSTQLNMKKIDKNVISTPQTDKNQVPCPP